METIIFIRSEILLSHTSITQRLDLSTNPNRHHSHIHIFTNLLCTLLSSFTLNQSSYDQQKKSIELFAEETYNNFINPVLESWRNNEESMTKKRKELHVDNFETLQIAESSLSLYLSLMQICDCFWRTKITTEGLKHLLGGPLNERLSILFVSYVFFSSNFSINCKIGKNRLLSRRSSREHFSRSEKGRWLSGITISFIFKSPD
jgi:hypothetical protein